jgi:two-component system, cell cycle response regulator
MSPKPHDRTLSIERTVLDIGRLRKQHAALVVLQGAEIGRNFRLRRGPMLIGRGFGVEIRVADERVSREHARLDCRWDSATQTTTYTIVDLGSTNHTFVNTGRVETAALREGDKIQVGETVLKFVLLDDIEARFHEEIRNRISYDQLTGLLARESLYLALETELARCARYSLPLAVLMMDLDRFKSVNDRHGHLMGSHVLAEVGGLIRRSIRAADVAARYGGEEFVAYLSETNLAGAAQVAERIRTAIDRHRFTLDGTTLAVTISIGIACCPEHGRDIGTLVRRADRALYRAKSGGRNRVCIETKDRSVSEARS